MCGIAGFVDLGRSGVPDEQIASRMSACLRHRGPDWAGLWSEKKPGLALAVRRLAIQDLGPSGHQPMRSASGRYVIAYNGEIYNFPQLRQELCQAEVDFRGASDTEVLLAAIESWGLEKALARCRGAFAFALWDSRDQSLILVRDRVGEKPLYYARVGSGLVFASELRALLAHPEIDFTVDRRSLDDLVTYGFVSTPRSILDRVHKVPPATFVVWKSRTRILSGPHRYWSAAATALVCAKRRKAWSRKRLVEQLAAALRASVRQQLVADEPVGAFLSGGVDSSLIVALMQDLSATRVRTYTVRFDEQAFDESRNARNIARHLGTLHTELLVTQENVLAALRNLGQWSDEPLGDPALIPTYLLARRASRHVKVVLSGDGADELFGGYGRYDETLRAWPWIRVVPPAVRRLLSSSSLRRGNLSRLFELLESTTQADLYRRILAQCPIGATGVLKGDSTATLTDSDRLDTIHLSGLERLKLLDFDSYLPDDILTKLDRASMAAGIEARVPILDPTVTRLAWILPRHLKGKNLLRNVLEAYLPRQLIARRKQGFEMPIGCWLRTRLRGWGEDLLASERLRRDGFFDPVLVRQRWKEHLQERRDWRFYLWRVLVFQQWYGDLKSLRSSQGHESG